MATASDTDDVYAFGADTCVGWLAAFLECSDMVSGYLDQPCGGADCTSFSGNEHALHQLLTAYDANLVKYP